PSAGTDLPPGVWGAGQPPIPGGHRGVVPRGSAPSALAAFSGTFPSGGADDASSAIEAPTPTSSSDGYASSPCTATSPISSAASGSRSFILNTYLMTMRMTNVTTASQTMMVSAAPAWMASCLPWP